MTVAGLHPLINREEKIRYIYINLQNVSLCISLLLCFLIKPAFSADITLSWDPPTENADGTPLNYLSGYKLYYGTSSGNYTTVLDVKNTTTYTVNNLSEGYTYYFAVTAYDINGNESSFSNEVSKSVSSTPLYKLSIVKNGSGNGSITSLPSKIACESNCEEYYPEGTVVTLNYSTTVDSTFSGWTGECSGTALTCTVIMNSDVTVGATFYKKTFSIISGADLNGIISPSGTSLLYYGGNITYTITPYEGFEISDVVVDGVSIGPVNTYTFSNVTSNHTIVAYFSPLPIIEPPSDEDITVYEDAEDGMVLGWEIYDNDPPIATIANTYDIRKQSRVIELTGYALYNGYRLRNPDFTPWNNTTQHIIEWHFSFNEMFMVFIDVETSDGQRYLSYLPMNWQGSYSGNFIFLGLGDNLLNNGWQRVVRDLEADLKTVEPYNSILKVNGFLIYGSGRVDDIKLHSIFPSE